MTRIISRIRSTIAGIVRPPSPSLFDAALRGAHNDPAIPAVDHGAAVKAGSPIDRLRSQRRDLAAALRAGAGQPERELTAWPPVIPCPEPCRAC